MSDFEVIARFTIRPDRLEGFKRQAAELIRLTREQDTRTLRYDWFVDEATLEGEVHEAYIDEQGLIEHNQHVMAAREVLFREYADNHRMSVFAPISPYLAGLFEKHAGGVAAFTFVQGLEVAGAAR